MAHLRQSYGEAFPVINPATEEQIGEIAETTEREIEAAIDIAAKAAKARGGDVRRRARATSCTR